MIIRLGQHSDPHEVIADVKRSLQLKTSGPNGEFDHLAQTISEFISRVRQMAASGNQGRIEKEFKIGSKKVKIIADTSYQPTLWNRFRALIGL